MISWVSIAYDTALRIAGRGLVLTSLLAGLLSPQLSAQSKTSCVVISGLGGMPEYQENFVSWALKTEQLCRDLGAEVRRIDAAHTRRDEILAAFDAIAAAGPDDFWLFMIGHGNHDGSHFKFNIRGPDLTGEDLMAFFARLPSSRIQLVAATSASGALLDQLKGDNRVVVTATRNQFERQPPLFFSFFVEAAGSPEADSNKDGKVSLLEAFNFSRKAVADWYEERGRIQTEHAVLMDASSKRLEAGKEEEDPEFSSGTGWLAASAFLSRPPERAYRSLETQALVKERSRVEREIEDLKFRKSEMPQDQYFQELEKLLVELAQINEKIEALEQDS